MNSTAVDMDQERGNEKRPAPAFIRLSDPPTFDISRHMNVIKSQLPEDQMANLERALKENPSLFEKADKNDLILDCSAEESFTLETFGGLLKAARAAEKDFIIARVRTLDPSTERPQLFHSHYSAHHLNKILFKTQPEEGLLHRMKSRNPLNNMLIVGDVDYFVVRPEDYDAAMTRFEQLKSGQSASEAGRQAAPTESTSSSCSSTTTTTTESRSLFDLLRSGRRNASSPEINVAPFENAKDFTSPEPSNMELVKKNNGSSSSLTRTNSLNALPTNGEPAALFDAHPFATDDDFLMRSDVREYFKKNSVNADDYLLFTLYRNNGANNVTEIPVTGFTSIPVADVPTVQRRVKSWKNFWGLFYPPSPSISTLRTGVISSTAFKYILALYVVACVASLIFLVPIEWSYFVGLGMFVFILVVTVFFVECNPSPDVQRSRWNPFANRQQLRLQRENAMAAANITQSSQVGAHDNTSRDNLV